MRFWADGQELPFWGGLRVVHCRDIHGHCGFSARSTTCCSRRHVCQLFFGGPPAPAILNSAPEQFAASVEKVRQLNPRWIVQGHYDLLDGARHRRRFARLNNIAWPAIK
jgi:hypothetical protein